MYTSPSIMKNDELFTVDNLKLEIFMVIPVSPR